VPRATAPPPYGLAFDAAGTLYVTDNAYDTRGSRPVFGGADALWRVEPGTWYGWPDHAEGRPPTDPALSEADGDVKGLVLARAQAVRPSQPPTCRSTAAPTASTSAAAPRSATSARRSSRCSATRRRPPAR
jgi:hypothetical protein